MADTIWLITVAQAAPAIPQLYTNINKGSKIVFNIAPITIATIEYFALPSALIKGLTPIENNKNGIP